MRLDVKRTGASIVVTVVGQVDAEGGRQLSDTVGQVLEDPTIRHAVFNLAEVPAVTSAGIGKLLRFYKHFDKVSGTMKIKGISAPLKQQFQEIHLDRIIPIED